jgi:hypothetical protein
MTSRTIKIFWIANDGSNKPPLPPNKPYHRPFNYLDYVKDSDPNVHVRVFKTTIRANGEIEDVDIDNLFCFTLRDIVFD